MRLGSLDAVNGNVSNVQAQENIMKAAHAENANAVNDATADEGNRDEWQVSENFLKKAVDKANKTMALQKRSLEFKIHEKTGEIIVKVIDSETKEVIREIPPEKILDMFASMLEIAGLLVDERR